MRTLRSWRGTISGRERGRPRACPSASRPTHPRTALLHTGQHPQRAGRAGAEVEEVQGSARRQLQDPAWQPHRRRGPRGDIGVLPGSRAQCEAQQQPEAQQQRGRWGSTRLHGRGWRGPRRLRGCEKLAPSSPNRVRGVRGNRPRRPLPSAPGSPPFLAAPVQAEGPESASGKAGQGACPRLPGERGQRAVGRLFEGTPRPPALGTWLCRLRLLRFRNCLVLERTHPKG